MEQEYYSKIYEYESMGKVYSGERACISLTSWKARINTCSKTIYSLLKNCPGFHIVLVLSKDEFPLKEKELPDNLMLFVNNKLIELLWIKPNLKSFKKVLFTMDKYRNVPVISADDDCIYTCNYAQELYDKWLENKNSPVIYSYHIKPCYYTFGPATLHAPTNYKYLINKDITEIENEFCGDDDYYTYQYYNNGVKIINCYYEIHHPFIVHDDSAALSITTKGKISNKIGYSTIIKFSQK